MSNLRLVGLGAATCLMLGALSCLLCACDSSVVPTDRVNGMPLDACSVVAYDRPVWLPDCNHAYKVYDRTSGDAWWLLVMHEDTGNESYVVLPLEEAGR